MPYVHERDGPAACPDDFARTGAPDDGMTATEEAQFAVRKTFYTDCTRSNVKDTLTGRMSSAVVVCRDQLHVYPDKDIAELLHDQVTYEDFVVLLAGYISPVAHGKAKAMVDQLIEDLAIRTGDRLAEIKSSHGGSAS